MGGGRKKESSSAITLVLSLYSVCKKVETLAIWLTLKSAGFACQSTWVQTQAEAICVFVTELYKIS